MPPPQAPNNYAQAGPTQVRLPQQPNTIVQPSPAETTTSPTATSSGPRTQQTSQSQPRQANASVHTAAASLETIERALGDLRISNQTQNGRVGGGRGGAGGKTKIQVPATDFDFASSNAKFDKAALGPKKGESDGEDDTSHVNGSQTKDGEKGKAKDKEEKPTAYDPQKSFFDSLSPAAAPSRGVGRRGNSGAGRNRREEERERNVATFGEPGGVGLMGPGAYVGGWGTKRVGRPRRGHGHGQNQSTVDRAS